MATLDELMAKLPVSTEYAIAKPKSVEELMSDIGLKAKSFSPDYTRTREIANEMTEINKKWEYIKQKSIKTQNSIDEGIEQLKNPVKQASPFEAIGYSLLGSLTNLARMFTPVGSSKDTETLSENEKLFREKSLYTTKFGKYYEEQAGLDLKKKEQEFATKANLDSQSFVTQVIAGAISSLPTSLITRIPYIGWVIMANQSYRNSLEQTTQKEQETGKQFSVVEKYGKALGDAAIEVGTELIFPLFGKVSKTVGKGVLKSSLANGTKGLLESIFKKPVKEVIEQGSKITVKEMGKIIAQTGMEEGLEEGIGAFATGILSKLTTEKDTKLFGFNDNDSLISFVGVTQAMLSGSLMGSGMSLVSASDVFVNAKKASNILNKPISKITIDDYNNYRDALYQDMQKAKEQQIVQDIQSNIIENNTPEEIKDQISKLISENGGTVSRVSEIKKSIPEQIQDIKTLGSDIQQSVTQDGITSTVNAENQLVLREGQNINISKTPIEQKPQYTELMRNNINNINKQVVDDIKNGNTVLSNGNITLQVRDGELMLATHIASRDYYKSTENALRGLSKFYLDYNLPEQSKKMDALYAKLQNINVDNLSTSEVIQKLKPIWNDISSANAYVEAKKRSVTPQKTQETTNVEKTYYHGTNADFNKFVIADRTANGSNLGRGIYFTSDYEMASRYGKNIMTVKLDIKKPLYMTGANGYFKQNELSPEWIQKTLDEFRDYIDDDITSKTGINSEYKTLSEMYSSKKWSDASIVADISKRLDENQLRTFYKKLRASYGYDAIMSKNETVVFNPSQVKQADNITSNAPTTAQKPQEDVSVSKAKKVPSEKAKAVKTPRSASIADIVSKRQRGEDIDKDLDDWLKYSEEAMDIRSIKNEDEYIEKVQELNTLLNQSDLTQDKLDKINLQLFALKKWEDRISQNIKGKRISLYAQHLIEALKAGKLEDVQTEIEANFKDSDLFHYILGNEQTIKKAEAKVEKGKDRYLQELERKMNADKDYIPAPDEIIAISMYCKKLIDDGNIVRADQLAAAVSKRLTKAGQVIQVASLLKRVFPEYQAKRIIKEVEKTVPFEDKRILDNDTKDTADILGKHRKDAVNDTVDEVTKEQKPKTVAEKLLDSIMRKTKIHEKYLASEETDSTRLLTEEQRLLKALFRKFQSELPKRETKVQNRVYGFIQDIILNRDLYSRTWEEAQRIGKERPEIVNSDTYGFLEMLTDPIVAKSLFKTAIAQKLSDSKESLNTRAKEYFLVGNESYNQFVEMLAQDMPYLDTWGKKYLHEYMRETFDTMMNNKRYQAMQSLKNKVEARKKLKKQVETQDIIVGKLMDIAYKDGFSISEIRSEWAKRMGITDISDTMKQDIYQTMRDIAKEKDENIKDELYDAMVSRISKQIIATPYEKAVAIIRFSLLMRPQTLLRNMLSNFAFMPQYRLGSMLANKIMRINKVNAEDLIAGERYKKFDPDTALGKLVLEQTTYKEIERYLEKTEKYDMKTMFNKDKTYFKNNTVDEVINKSVGNVLTEGKIGKFQFKPLGDIYMYTRHFREAMYNKLMALGYNEILPEETKTDMINKAKEYANQYATRGVFREMNLMTAFVKNIMTFNWKRISTLRNAGKYAEARNLERAQNAFRYIVQSVYRFVVTPAAIGAEVYRFSPFALASSIAFDYFGAKAKGTWAESEQRAIFSRKLADATTGTLSTFALGMIMSFLGLVNAEAPDDEKEKRMWELEGRKAWSIYIPGVGSIAIDWLQPIAGPFMLGASMLNSFRENGFSYDAVKKVADGSIDILMNLSLINNIKQTFGDKYATTTDTIEDFMINTGYQFIPRLLIDFNKILDPYVRDVYSGNTIQNISYKVLSAIPGASYLIPAKTDVWGNPVRNTKSEGALGVVERFMLNFISPFTVSTANMDSVTKEVIRVFNETGLKEGLPTVPDKTIKYPKSEGREAFEYTLTPDEYEAFRTAVGNLYYNKMKTYMNSSNYKTTSNGDTVSDTTHSKNFKKLYDKAREEIVSQFIKKNPK